MRIAICFSGQIRTGIESSENIIRFIGDLFPQCDFFIHTWDINKYINYQGTRISYPDEKIPNETFEKIKEIYSPKKMLIENFNEIKNQISTYNDPFKYLWYSFYKSIEMKRLYEIENNFTYDLVIKLRFDIIFPDDRRLKNNCDLISNNINDLIYIESHPKYTDVNENLYFVNDLFFIGSSKNMDIKSKYYEKIIKDGYFGYNLLKYLGENGISFVETDLTLKYTIYRPECLKYSPISEFEECLNCNDYYYHYYPIEEIENSKLINDLKKKYDITDDLLVEDSNDVVFINELKKKL